MPRYGQFPPLSINSHTTYVAFLIGGPRDGERIAVEDVAPRLVFPVLLPHSLHPWCAGDPSDGSCLAPNIEKIEYRLEGRRWGDLGGPHAVELYYEHVEPTNESLRHHLAQEHDWSFGITQWCEKCGRRRDDAKSRYCAAG